MVNNIQKKGECQEVLTELVGLYYTDYVTFACT